VSSDEQAETDTIQMQLDYLHRYCELNQLQIADIYRDDGVSGTLPLAKRKDGPRLLQDAKSGKFQTVLFMRVNRFARRLRIALNECEELADAGVAIKSATEPIDSGDAGSRLFFQMLGAFAEFDRETIVDNTARGRARGAKNGRWYGVVPLGYVVQDRRLAPNSGEIAPGVIESLLVVEVFERIAGGSSGVRETVRLAALGIEPFMRYMRHDGTELIKPSESGWTLSRITRMIRNPLYKGSRTFRGRHGEIEQEVPALVSAELWERANEQLSQNRRLSKRNATRSYPMRGLMRCGTCGSAYRGAFVTTNERRYYRCRRISINSGADAANGPARKPCGGKVIDANWIEGDVWSACEAFLGYPEPVFEEARRQYLARNQIILDFAERHRALTDQLAANDQERDTIIRMARRGVLRDDEIDGQLGELARDHQALEEQLRSLLALQAQAETSRQQEQSIDRLLARMRAYLARGVGDDTKMDIIHLLVDRIVVETNGTGQSKRAEVRVVYRFPAPEMSDLAPSTTEEMRTQLRTA